MDQADVVRLGASQPLHMERRQRSSVALQRPQHLWIHAEAVLPLQSLAADLEHHPPE